MIRVLIVEDQKMAQENMEAIINSNANYTLAGTIANAADAELFCMREGVDLILMDVCTLRDENGILGLVCYRTLSRPTAATQTVQRSPCCSLRTFALRKWQDLL